MTDADYADDIVLQANTPAQAESLQQSLETYLMILVLYCSSIDKMKVNSFKLTKERSRRYPAQTITGEDYGADIALLTNTPAQAVTLLHSLEPAAAGIGLHVNADKTEYMCFNQRGDTKGWSSESNGQVHLPRM